MFQYFGTVPVGTNFSLSLVETTHNNQFTSFVERIHDGQHMTTWQEPSYSPNPKNFVLNNAGSYVFTLRLRFLDTTKPTGVSLEATAGNQSWTQTISSTDGMRRFIYLTVDVA